MKEKWKVWAEIAGYFSVFLISFIVSAIIFMFISYLNQGEFIVDYESNINNILLVGIILSLLVYMFIVRKDKRMTLWKYCNLNKLTLSDILLAVGLGIILSISIGFLTQLDIFQGLSTSHEEKISSETQSDSILVVMLGIGILVPFVEEIIFRGLLFQTLKAQYSLTTTIIIQAIFFAVIHVNPLQVIYTFILALIYIWLVISFKSLWASILIHMSFNLTTIVILEFIQKTESVLLFLLLIIFAILSFLTGILTRLIKSKVLARKLNL